MKTCWKFFATLIVSVMTCANAGNSSSQQAYIHSLANFLPTFTKQANLLWPGLNIDSKALVITFDTEKNDRSVYALNFTPRAANWQRLSDEQIPIYFMSDDIIGAHTFIPTLQSPYLILEEKSAIKYSPSFYMLEDQYQLDHAILAGSYYVYYELNDSPYAKDKLVKMGKPYPAHTGFNQADSLSLLLLESFALNTYLDKHDEEALRDFAAIHHYRQQHVDPSTQQFDHAYPALPCTTYIMLKASLSDQEMTEKLLGEFPDHDTDYAHFANHQHLTDYLDALSFNQTAASVALDHLGLDWKMEVEAKNMSPVDLLQAHYQTNSAEMNARFENAKMRYGYDKLFATLENDLKPYLHKMETLQNLYQQNNGVELIIHLPSQDYLLVNYEADGGAYHVDSQLMLHYKTTTLKNISDVMSLDGRHLNIVYHHKQLDNFLDLAASNHTLTIKLPPDAKITADLTNEIVGRIAGKDQVMSLHKFSVVASGDQGFTLKVSVAGSNGQLKVVEGKIHIYS